MEVRISSGFQKLSVVLEMIAEESGDEIVAVVVSFLLA
jgi:hypothetical protein